MAEATDIFMEMSFYILISLFFLTALLYSSAGLGGGSTYLALLALFGLSYTSIPLFALSCNILVVSGGFWHFYRAGHFRLKNVLPFLVTSIPLAYLGGSLSISKKVFSLLLALSLACAAFRLFLREEEKLLRELSWKEAYLFGVPVGGLIGFLSGLIGIGGGIFLSPLLMLFRWANSKQAAAAASLFILVNSVSGLLGQLSKGPSFEHATLLLPLLMAVFIGSQIGARWGAFQVSKLTLQRLSAGIILFASVRILWGLCI